MSLGHPQKCTNKKRGTSMQCPVEVRQDPSESTQEVPLMPSRWQSEALTPCTFLRLKLAGFNGNVQSSVNSEPYSIVAYNSIILPENVKKIPDIGKNYPTLIVFIKSINIRTISTCTSWKPIGTQKWKTFSNVPRGDLPANTYL
jgi:hypothetical protein